MGESSEAKVVRWRSEVGCSEEYYTKAGCGAGL